MNKKYSFFSFTTTLLCLMLSIVVVACESEGNLDGPMNGPTDELIDKPIEGSDAEAHLTTVNFPCAETQKDQAFDAMDETLADEALTVGMVETDRGFELTATATDLDAFADALVNNGIIQICSGERQTDAPGRSGGGAWTWIPGGAQDIGIGANGAVFVIGTEPYANGGLIYKWTGSGWVNVPGQAIRVDVDPLGRPWVVDRQGRIFWGDGGGSWSQVAGHAIDVGVGANGQIWVIGAVENQSGGRIYKWNGSGWSAVSGWGYRVDVDGSGKPWVVDKVGYAWQGDGWGNWEWMQYMPSTDIGVGADGTVYTTGKEPNVDSAGGGYVYKWTGRMLQRVNGIAAQVSVAPDGTVWVVNANGAIFRGIAFQTIVVVSLHGASPGSEITHEVVREAALAEGYYLYEGSNWERDSGDTVASDDDALRIKGLANDLANNVGPKSGIKLIVVGKSAGGVLAWNYFKRHYTSAINNFGKSALLTIDPHGSVTNDGVSGPYKKSQALWWPSQWTNNTNKFRVYNIFQWEAGLTGASFDSGNVWENSRFRSNVNHDNIPTKAETKAMIRRAFKF